MTELYVRVPRSLWRATNISAMAKDLLALLDDYRNTRTGRCDPKITTLAKDLGTSLRTLKRSLAELARLGLIKIVRRRRSSNQYDVAPRVEWETILKCQNGTSKTASLKCQNDTTDRGQNGTSRAPHLFNEPNNSFNLASAPAAASKNNDRVRQPKPTVKAASAAQNSSSQNEHKNGVDGLVLTLRNDLIDQHPEKGNPKKALLVICSILGASTDPAATAAAIRESHRAWREAWNARLAHNPQAFVPQLWRWFESEEYKHPPSAADIEVRRKHPTSMRRQLPRLKELL